ncbi:MAG: MBL fold metallo-hydrolase [Promethearchaeota archaeon]|nr:MAG: MBL fold metallo-hydrolase [Candidatus Lokiarchaeota archaeon]
MTDSEKQYVCIKCGYNMIGHYFQFCPFCGASNANFITAEECSQRYKIVSSKVNNKVLRLSSYPSLGLEHSAYSIKIDNTIIWIDCPSTFTKDLEPMDKILFTHHHFLGASNLYRGYYTTFIWIHKNDSEHLLSKKHPFDKKFTQDFKLNGIEAFHIDGHTPGFTFYIFEKVLFICDYLIQLDEIFILNPYGPGFFTIEGAEKLNEIIQLKEIDTVCGFNYVMNYQNWEKKFLGLLSD